MNDAEHKAHLILRRLEYLLTRLDGEFFHLHPDVEKNGSTTSLALSSILNEAVNIQESIFPGNFFTNIKDWNQEQDWHWNDVNVRFTWWPVCIELQPFRLNEVGTLWIGGRDANNRIKHDGELAILKETIEACAATWFLALEN